MVCVVRRRRLTRTERQKKTRAPEQIGVLRAIGFRKGMVQLSFLIESSSIALTAIPVGNALGLAVAYNVVDEYARQPSMENLSRLHAGPRTASRPKRCGTSRKRNTPQHDAVDPGWRVAGEWRAWSRQRHR